MRGAGFVTFISMLYPIAWGVSEGGNVISPTQEMIFYGILDILLGPVFLYYFVWGLRNVEYGLFGLHSGKYSDGAYGTGTGAFGHAGAGYRGGVGEKPGVTGTGAGVPVGASAMGPRAVDGTATAPVAGTGNAGARV